MMLKATLVRLFKKSKYNTDLDELFSKGLIKEDTPHFDEIEEIKQYEEEKKKGVMKYTPLDEIN